ncbi:Zinc finger, CCHC-type domain and Aspartic peptidase domain-containing protein [Strongyloides ratti]|uniref:Zinc finger, CCHC-type domain and Aspartic peptidase domain-containing protein n=1 Tax=Strongyloides ratti TaxID=34506 RepID=A0A090MT51_STRRB|nr:Zinc finger, CCHC-type domain and Aspartic peptidase domain-containing protein [Strongyloides ratti]CEF61498.1 Zinc finger, CCHC-type domain and Aspartic peptidase domain-containing protein [Strongyloides ratti]
MLSGEISAEQNNIYQQIKDILVTRFGKISEGVIGETWELVIAKKWDPVSKIFQICQYADKLRVELNSTFEEEKSANQIDAATWIYQAECAFKLDKVLEEEKLDILLFKLNLQVVKEIRKLNIDNLEDLLDYLKETIMILMIEKNLEQSLLKLASFVKTAHPKLDEEEVSYEIHTRIITLIHHNKMLANVVGFSLGNRSIRDLITEMCTALAMDKINKNVKNKGITHIPFSSNEIKSCNFCKKVGHVESQCKKKTNSCFKCGSLNHKIGSCSSNDSDKKKTSISKVECNNITVTSDKKNNKQLKMNKILKCGTRNAIDFIVPIHFVNDITVLSMLDSDAEKSLMSESLYFKLDACLNPVNVLISCANKSAITYLGESVLRVKIGPLLHDATFFIVKHSEIPSDKFTCLLGRDFLSQIKEILDYELGELTMKGC